MKTPALLLLAAILASSPAAGADDATARKDLVEDISSALMLATCGRAPNAICHASDGIPESELRARWGRVSQLCRRYKDRYKGWPENGSCDSIKQSAERAERQERCDAAFRKGQDPSDCQVERGRWSTAQAAALSDIRLAKAKMLGSGSTPERLAAVEAACSKYEERFGSTPGECR